MNYSFKSSIIALILIVGIVFIVSIVRFYFLAQKSKIILKNAIPFERDIPSASMNILVLGDSTAVGSGSEKPELSTAGRLGALYTQARIQNLGVNGLKLQGLLGVIEKIDPQEHFSLILIQIGANDIIQFTNMDDVERDINKVLARLTPQTDKLIVLHSGDIGETKLFPFYLRPLYTSRSFTMRDIYKKVALLYNAYYIDLINSPSRALFRDYPKKYYAADFLHLNGAGYELWFRDIFKALTSSLSNEVTIKLQK